MGRKLNSLRGSLGTTFLLPLSVVIIRRKWFWTYSSKPLFCSWLCVWVFFWQHLLTWVKVSSRPWLAALPLVLKYSRVGARCPVCQEEGSGIMDVAPGSCGITLSYLWEVTKERKACVWWMDEEGTQGLLPQGSHCCGSTCLSPDPVPFAGTEYFSSDLREVVRKLSQKYFFQSCWVTERGDGP